MGALKQHVLDCKDENCEVCKIGVSTDNAGVLHLACPCGRETYYYDGQTYTSKEIAIAYLS